MLIPAECCSANVTTGRVADKYKDVLKLEKSVEELHQMFLDMAFLVEQQGEMLDQIEFQARCVYISLHAVCLSGDRHCALGRPSVFAACMY